MLFRSAIIEQQFVVGAAFVGNDHIQIAVEVPVTKCQTPSIIREIEPATHGNIGKITTTRVEVGAIALMTTPRRTGPDQLKYL